MANYSYPVLELLESIELATNEPVKFVFSMDVSTGIARVHLGKACLVNGECEVDAAMVDGVRLICSCGTEITKEMIDGQR